MGGPSSSPVVVLTSSREQEDVLASYRGGTNGYVRKPMNEVTCAQVAADDFV